MRDILEIYKIMKKILVLILLYIGVVPALAGFSITLNSPVNGTFTNDNTPDFNFTVIGNRNSYSCELFIDGESYGTATANNNTATVITANSNVSKWSDFRFYNESIDDYNPGTLADSIKGIDSNWSSYAYDPSSGAAYNYMDIYWNVHPYISQGLLEINWNGSGDGWCCVYDKYLGYYTPWGFGSKCSDNPAVTSIGNLLTSNIDSYVQDNYFKTRIYLYAPEAPNFYESQIRFRISDSAYIWYINCSADYTLNTFNNSLSKENLTFTGNQNITRYIRLSKNANVTSAYLNIKGEGCKTPFNDSYNQSYESFDAQVEGISSVDNPSNAYDENWSTYCLMYISNGLEQLNLTEEFNVTVQGDGIKKIKFIYKMNSGTGCGGVNLYYHAKLYIYNYTSSSYDLMCDRQHDYYVGGIVIDECEFGFSPDYNSSTGTIKAKLVMEKNDDCNAGNFRIYEMNVTYIYYNISYLSNLYIDVADSGGVHEWNWTGNFTPDNGTQTVNLNATLINNYLSTCTPDSEGYCNVPILFHSDSTGILEVSNIEINYTISNSSNSRTFTIDTVSPTINWLKLIVDDLGKNNLISLIVNAFDLHIDTAKFDIITNSSWSNNQTTLDINDLLYQSGTIYVNDSATNLDTYILNYTLTNNPYYQNTSFNANLSEQRIYKNDTLYNYANNNLTYHITHYNKSASTLITGGTFTGELAGNSNINLYSEWSGDWLTQETKGNIENSSYLHNLSSQGIISYLQINNIAINFTNVNISSYCSYTTLVNISSGVHNVTLECDYPNIGDWLSETWLDEQDISKTSNLSKQYLRHRLNVSNTIDVNFTNVNWLFDNPISGETLTIYTGTVDIPANSYNDTKYAYGYGDWLYEIDSQYTANLTEAGGNAWIKRDINNTIDINFTNIQNIGREGWTCTKQTINISANQFIENATICNKTNVITKQQSNNTIYNDTVIVDSYVDAYYWVSGSNTDTINYSNVLVQTTLPDWATNTSPYIFSINLNSGGTYNLTVNITGKPAVETGYTFTKTQVGGGEKNIYTATIQVYDSAVSEKEIWYYIPKSRLLNYEGGVSKTYIVDDRTSGFSVQDTNTSVIIKIPTTFGSSSLELGAHQIRITYWTAGQLPTGGGGGAPIVTEYLKVSPEIIRLNITQPGNYTVKLNITWSGPTATAKFDYSDELIPYIVSPKKYANIELKGNVTTINITFCINETELAQQITALIKKISGKISIKVTHMGAVYLRYIPVDISIYKGVPPPPVTPVCGNGICEPGENWLNCPEDCGGERIIKGLIFLVVAIILIVIVTRI
ncbi:MAG TPA: hypothetical protein ENG63_05340 [Candidatus Desulfofervidus auxilii]|uniref:Uncharacterized protein n=1 Tax=Desulfofervidus auxilii TaxID=1621989 RepID=A0A7C0Y2K7_DESA2|nr:hypothetical protein [Candidatus Desulfofervidus auxilii]